MPQQIWTLWKRKGLRRGIVVVFIVAAAAVLTKVLPVNKALPCPWCTISSLIGWMYFMSWTVSFYPQVFVNARRKSVEGLSLDFVALNVLGFAAYSGFNLALFCSPAVQQEYAARFGGVLPVELNDVLFGLHALLLSSVTALQAAVYRKGPGQRLSTLTVTAIIGVAGAAAAAVGVLVLRGEGAPPATWLDLAYAASAIKMAVSLCKYVPQLVLNATRRSTAGWSIDNVLLDATGGLLSFGQLLATCVVLSDWTPLVGNPIKTGLGLVSVAADAAFLLQHYVLYPGCHAKPAGAGGRYMGAGALHQDERQTAGGAQQGQVLWLLAGQQHDEEQQLAARGAGEGEEEQEEEEEAAALLPGG